MNRKSLCLNLLIVVLLLATNVSHAQRPDKVVSIVKENHDFNYYKSLAQQWKVIIDKNPSDADAWFNYYYANRYAKMFSQEYEKSHEKYFEDDRVIVENASKAIPDTYEYYFLKASVVDDPVVMMKEKYVLKAYQLNPNRPENYSLMVNYYEMLRDADGKKEICNRWFNSNDMSPALLNYNYNVLATLDDNAILITNGDNDTYPIWLLQEAKGIKKNVTVLNVYLISYLPEYRDKVFRELNIPPFKNTPDAKDEGENGLYRKVLEHILNNSSRPVYLANTLSNDFYDAGIEKDLYIVGLAMLYSKSDVDNLALIRNNYENIYLLDYLSMGFGNDPSSKLVAYMNLGYEPMLLKLYKHYKYSGENAKAEKAKKLGVEIAKEADMEKDYTSKFADE